MYLLKQELAWYTTFRHKFLQQRKPRNYAVYVSGIPEELRSGPLLAVFFRQTAATSQVLEAHVTLACPELDNLVAQRDTVKKALKHAKAYEEIHGERERRFETQVSLPWFGGKKKKRKKNKTGSSTYGGIGIVAQVDSIESLERKLRQLTKDISFAYQNIERANDPHTLEEHRQMVMEEIEELHKAEVLQNAANRERAGSSHDVTQVEEIYHDPLEAPVVVEEEHTDSKDSFSEGVEKMFFGGLRKRRQQQAEERERFLNNTTEPARGNRVRIHTSENSVHSYNSVPSMEPISDSDDMEGVPAANAKDNKFEKPQFQRTFPSKSTITTAPGMFDDMVKNSSSDTTSSGKDLEQSNDHFRYPGRYISMPNIAEDQSGTVESITEQKTNDNEGLDESYVWRITREGEDSDNDEDDVGRSSRSWGSARDSSTRKAFRFLQRTGAGVGGGIKSVHEVGMNTTKKTVRLAGELGVKNVMKVGEFGVENIRTIGASAAAVVPMNMIVGHPEGKPLEAGFVVFKDLYTTQAALQMLHHEKASMMRASEAPGEDEIFWPNVGLPESAQRTGRLLSLAATTLLCFFWTIPVAFVSGLTEVNALKKDVDFLADWVEKFPGLENLLAVVAPLLLLILQDVILPEFLMWFAAWEGHVASSALEASVFVKYAAFVVSILSAVSLGCAIIKNGIDSQPVRHNNKNLDMFISVGSNVLYLRYFRKYHGPAYQYSQ